MKKFLSSMLILSALALQSQTKLYVHPDAGTYVAGTKTIAILPLDTSVKLRPKELKDFTPEQIKEIENEEALNIQKAMYSWFLTREKRGELLVGVQNPTVTNSLLKDAGIEPLTAFEQIPANLCEILGVDVVVTGKFSTNKPMSDAAALGLAVIGFVGATQNATANMDFIHKDNEVVVNYYKNVKGGLGSSADDLINVLMRKVSRRIPYTK
ncbi:hypothetical protein [Muriicola marianensis]|uniref:Secreted protein n=1 Tax=Muriicola marianensis TaxID=1324801 RepID=A0ABQ1QVT1_9FLAO|nr:hypothetical protein [Muriicola marianensis]GGD45924.1 hypothetical protein GCM10011361_11120 [Muriicola marianensis]